VRSVADERAAGRRAYRGDIPGEDNAPIVLVYCLGQTTSRHANGDCRVLSAMAVQPIELSDSERRLLELAAEGLTTEEIAARLYVSVGTTKLHRRVLFSKLGARNATQAVAIALRDGHIR
jgi:DNA-binding NarL/FixJ family response regulator